MKILIGDSLVDFAKTISSRQDFEYFMTCLVEDYLQNKAEWENNSLENYLLGIGKFSTEMDGYYKNMGEEVDANIITWRIMAEILLAASVYGS